MTNGKDPNIVNFLNSIALAIDQILNGKEVAKDKSLRKNGFVLLVHPFGDTTSGRCEYVSNGDSKIDAINLFRSEVARFEEWEKSRDAPLS